MAAPSSTLDDGRRRGLLAELRGLGSDADAHPDIKKVFLPLPSHGAALRPAKLIVRGERGAGKTALFHLLHELSGERGGLATLFPDAGDLKGRWVVGFSERGKDHPSTDVIDDFGQAADDARLRAFWFGHLVGVLAQSRPELDPPPPSFMEAWSARRTEPAEWVEAAQAALGPLTTWLDRFDTRCVEERQWTFVAYDHLDKIGIVRPEVRNRFASTLLAMWLSLANRYDRLRGKIFLREDLFQASVRASTDASKLVNRSERLSWSTEDLYRVLLRHMAAASGLRCWLGSNPIKIPLGERGPLGWFPPEALPGEGRGCSQKAVADQLVGELMGLGVKKGYTYRWIPNHRQDAHGTIVPRSILNLAAFAAECSLQKGSKARGARLLHPSELQAALEKTSQYRAMELAEEHPVIDRMKNLRGMVLLANRRELVARLRTPFASREGGHTDDGFLDDGGAVLEELVQLGVLKIRPDKRVDVPDIYRFGFGIKRKGRVSRPR